MRLCGASCGLQLAEGSGLCARGMCPGWLHHLGAPSGARSPHGPQLVPSHWGNRRSPSSNTHRQDGSLKAVVSTQARNGAADLGIHCTDPRNLAACRSPGQPDIPGILVPAQGTHCIPIIGQDEHLGLNPVFREVTGNAATSSQGSLVEVYPPKLH